MNQQPTHEFPATIRARRQAQELARWSEGIKKSWENACDNGAEGYLRECEAILAISRAFDALVTYADVLDGQFLSGHDLLGQMADMASDMAGTIITTPR
jgi:hypothetical protein